MGHRATNIPGRDDTMRLAGQAHVRGGEHGMKSSGDLLDECNRNDTMQLPFFTIKGWLIILSAIAFTGGALGAMYYAYVLSPFTK